MIYKLIFLALFIAVACFIYAFFIEPNWIQVNRYILSEHIGKPIKIAHLTDLHIQSTRYREAKIIRLLELEKPDVVLITGDLVASNANYPAIKTFLDRLHAPLGVWVSEGNWEHWRMSSQLNLQQIAGKKLLDNTAINLTHNVWVVGVDDYLAGHPELKKAMQLVPKNAYKIGLIHSPEYFDQAGNEFNLVLSGHTHGGQIRLPLLPPFWLPQGSGRFVAGWYESEKSKMYVSRGLGNSILEMRFFCRPEIAIIELK